MKTYRQLFLEEFLKLYSVKSVHYKIIETDGIGGTAIYDLNDPEEIQDFYWHMKDENVPSKECFELMQIINENNWCDIDKIIVSEEKLFEISKMEKSTFENAFDELFEVGIKMIDDGEEADTFYVHM